MDFFGAMAMAKKTDAVTLDDRERLMAIYRSPSKPSLVKRRSSEEIQEDRIAALVDEAQKRAPPQIAQLLKQFGPILVPAIHIIITIVNILGPLYMLLFTSLYTLFTWMPWDLLEATIGVCLCFFGGGYCASIAACEAFLMTGWPTTKRHLTEVWESANAIIAANEADEKKDDDGDGVADVKKLPAAELIDRKFRVAAQAVEHPHQLAAALGGLYTGWLSVQGVLRIKFAKTINLAVSCSQFVEYYVTKALLPILTPFVAAEFVHWLPTAINGMTRGVFVYLAWKMQEVISAVQSGMRGGLMCARGLLNFANKQGVTQLGPFSLKHEHTYLDEVFGYLLAALGFYVQWNLGFSTPFPLNIVMMPFDLIEWYIRVSITSGGQVQV